MEGCVVLRLSVRLSVAIVLFRDNILPLLHGGPSLRRKLVGREFLDDGADNDTEGVGLRNTSSRISGRVSGRVSGNVSGHASGRLSIDGFFVSVFNRGLTRISSAPLQCGNHFWRVDRRGVGLRTDHIDHGEIQRFADDNEIEMLRRLTQGNTAGFVAQDDWGQDMSGSIRY